MTTANGLYEKYLRDLQFLQDYCTHERVSDWLMECWAPAHTTGRLVKQCEICDKVVATRMREPGETMMSGCVPESAAATTCLR